MAKDTKYGVPSLKKDFPTDEACLNYVFDSLHSRECSCGGSYKLIQGRKQFQCGKCRYQIAPMAGTIFHKSDTPLTLWFQAILLFSNAKSGISAKQLERELEVTYKCAWRILSQIRKALKQNDTLLRGNVEVDTAFIGGRKSGGKNNEELGKAIAAKSVVTAAIQRGGDMKAKTSLATANAMEDFIRKHIQKSRTWVLTDKARGYDRMRKDYYIDSVDHGKKQYVKGSVHINNVEAWFAHLKRSIRGTYKSISKKHLQSYLDAFVFLYNNRHSDRLRFEALLGSVLRPVG